MAILLHLFGLSRFRLPFEDGSDPELLLTTSSAPVVGVIAAVKAPEAPAPEVPTIVASVAPEAPAPEAPSITLDAPITAATVPLAFA